MRRVLLQCAAGAASMALIAQVAAAQIFTGTTAGGPTWNRPVAGNPPTPPPSGVGTNVRYSTLSFTVTAAGNYSFQNTATNPVNWDNFLCLYQSSFNPLAQFTNALVCNDDNPSIGLAGFTRSLATSTTYIAVTTGFSNTDFGAFSMEIRGPGTVVPSVVIPEPSTYALIGTGLAGLAFVRRRRRTL